MGTPPRRALLAQRSIHVVEDQPAPHGCWSRTSWVALIATGLMAAHIGDEMRLEEAAAGAPPDGSPRLRYGLSPTLAGMTGGRR
jgi:hypothetical protein